MRCLASSFRCSAAFSESGRVGFPLPGGIIGSGDMELDQLVRNPVAPVTWSAYGKARQEWLKCVGPLPIGMSQAERLQVMLDYLLHLCRSGAPRMVAQHRVLGISIHF